MALTKQDWIEHYNATDKIETLGMLICDLQEEIDDIRNRKFSRAEKLAFDDFLRYGHPGDWGDDVVDKILEERDELEGFDTEMDSLNATISEYEEEIRELRSDTIPVTAEGDSVESLQDEFDTTRRPEF